MDFFTNAKIFDRFFNQVKKKKTFHPLFIMPNSSYM